MRKWGTSSLPASPTLTYTHTPYILGIIVAPPNYSVPPNIPYSIPSPDFVYGTIFHWDVLFQSYYACWISSFKAFIKCSFLYLHPKQPLTLLSPCTASSSLHSVSHDLDGIKVTCAHGCISYLRDEAVTLIFSFFLLVARSSVWFTMSAYTLAEKLCIQQL